MYIFIVIYLYFFVKFSSSIKFYCKLLQILNKYSSRLHNFNFNFRTKLLNTVPKCLIILFSLIRSSLINENFSRTRCSVFHYWNLILFIRSKYLKLLSVIQAVFRISKASDYISVEKRNIRILVIYLEGLKIYLITP